MDEVFQKSHPRQKTADLAGNVTAWGDEVGLTVDLLEVSPRAKVASASYHARKRPGH